MVGAVSASAIGRESSVDSLRVSYGLSLLQSFVCCAKSASDAGHDCQRHPWGEFQSCMAHVTMQQPGSVKFSK